MHYKNGRAANEGDPVVLKTWNGVVVVGQLVDTNPSCDSCNATVVRPFGPPLTCQSVNQMYHAEDGFNALEPRIQEMPPPQEMPACACSPPEEKPA